MIIRIGDIVEKVFERESNDGTYAIEKSKWVYFGKIDELYLFLPFNAMNKGITVCYTNLLSEYEKETKLTDLYFLTIKTTLQVKGNVKIKNYINKCILSNKEFFYKYNPISIPIKIDVNKLKFLDIEIKRNNETKGYDITYGV